MDKTQLKERLQRMVSVGSRGDAGILAELNTIFDRLEQIQTEVFYKFNQVLQTVEETKKMQGPEGKTPTEEKLLSLIRPLIPQVKDGKDYILTDTDRSAIAGLIKVPVVEKTIEIQKVEVIHETPQITEVVKEVALKDSPQEIRNKLESIEDEEEKLKISAVRDLTEKLEDIDRRIKQGKGLLFGGGGGSSSSSSSGGGYIEATGTVDGSNLDFTFASEPAIIVVDGVPRRKTQSDGTSNWTGTTSVTLLVAPNFDVYGIA